jgi:two-component system sensor histidine kinase VanS
MSRRSDRDGQRRDRGAGRPGRGRRFTIRARIALTYSVLLAVTGALMLGGVYLFMRFVPTYALVAPIASTSADGMAVTARATAAKSSTIAFTAAPVVRSVNDVFVLLMLISVAAFVVLGVLGAVIGWVLAGRMLRPLQAINAVAHRASAGDLTQRVDASGPRDELRDLAETFDGMLATLDRSFGEHQRFAANASHELLTPIAATHTLLQVALADPDADARELRRVAVRVSELNRRNQETVESLLALADAGSARLERTDVRLDALVRDALTLEGDEIRYRAINVRTRLREVHVTGDAVLLGQAVRNLVQNAVRHNLDGGTLAVRLAVRDAVAVLDIANDGITLAADTVESLVEPFVRGAGRVAGSGVRGHGLGLALAQSVATAHRATLTLSPRDRGGLRVTLELPLGSDSGADLPSDS